MPLKEDLGLRTGTDTDQSDMGQGMIRGSNTPWAKGPANLVASPPTAGPFTGEEDSDNKLAVNLKTTWSYFRALWVHLDAIWGHL